MGPEPGARPAVGGPADLQPVLRHICSWPSGRFAGQLAASFGNTERIAAAVGEGLREPIVTELVPVCRAPAAKPAVKVLRRHGYRMLAAPTDFYVDNPTAPSATPKSTAPATGARHPRPPSDAVRGVKDVPPPPGLLDALTYYVGRLIFAGGAR